MALEGKKLILEGMPKLSASDLSVKAVVKWRAAISGWFKSQGLENYTIAGSLPDKVTDEQIRAGLRYVLAGIESQQLRDAISEEAQTGPQAWAFIAQEFLHGRDEQTVLHELLNDCTMDGTGKTAGC